MEELILAYTIVDGASATIHAIADAALAAARSLAEFGASLVERVVSFGESAVEAANSWQLMQLRMEALTGSAQKAGEELNFIRRLAIPTMFKTSELAEVANQMNAIGVNAERMLPTVAKLGMAFGSDPVHLQMLGRMIDMMSKGRLPGVRQLTQFGLSKEDFAREGVQFGRGLQIVSPPEQALAALEKIVTEKYGGILAKMKDATQAHLTTLADAWQQFTIRVGQMIQPFVNAVVDRMTALINAVMNSGVLADVLRAIAGGLRELTGAAGGLGWVRLIALALAWIEEIPAILSRTVKFLANAVTAVAGFVLPVYNVFINMIRGLGIGMSNVAIVILKVFTTVAKLALAVIANLPGVSGFANDMMGRLNAFEGRTHLDHFMSGEEWDKKFPMLRPIQQPGDLVNNLLEQFGFKDIQTTADRRASEFEARINAALMHPTDMSIPDTSKQPVWNAMHKAMADTAVNTAATARHTDAVQKALDIHHGIFGGGALGKFGVTPSELAGFRSGRGAGGPVVVRVDGARNLEQAVVNLIQDTVGQLRRQNAL